MDPISVSPSSSEQENTNGKIQDNSTVNARIPTNGQTLPCTGVTNSQPSQKVQNSTIQNTSAIVTGS